MNEKVQREACKEQGVEFVASPNHLKVGISDGAMSGEKPLHGLRHPPEGDTTGWYIWTGEYSDDPNFFKSMHVEHLSDLCPEVIKFLALPPGWRFLIANGHEDVWFDEQLIFH